MVSATAVLGSVPHPPTETESSRSFAPQVVSTENYRTAGMVALEVPAAIQKVAAIAQAPETH